MPAANPDLGTGTTVSFGTSSYACNIRAVNLGPITRPAIDTTHMGTTGARTFSVGDLVDNGTVELDCFFAPKEQPPTSTAAETVTITCPIPPGGSSGTTYAASMATISASIAIPLEDVMTMQLTLKILGAITSADGTG